MQTPDALGAIEDMVLSRRLRLVHCCLLATALALAGFAAPAASGPTPVRVGATDLHFAWASGSENVVGYRVLVSRNGGPFKFEQIVARGEAWIPADDDESIMIRVATLAALDQPGLMSPTSAFVMVLPPNEDDDSDGTPNANDACPLHTNDELDSDSDGIPNACDSCPFVSDPNGLDLDLDGYGDACDPDTDGDGIPDDNDLCQRLGLPETADSDGDGIGDRCDPCNTFLWSAPPRNPPDQNPRTAGILFKNLRTPENQAIRIEGKFSTVSREQPVDPSATGLSFHVEDAAGPIYALGIPPGLVGNSLCHAKDGWTRTLYFGSPVWKYTNGSGSLDPFSCAPAAAKLVSAIVRDKREKKGWIEYVVEFKNLDLDHVPQLPARSVLASISLGDHGSIFEPGRAARTASCGEAFLPEPADSGLKKPFCKPSYWSGDLNKITCRGL